MNLLIDLGNSRLKWALCDHGVVTKQRAIVNSQLNAEQLSQIWLEIKPQSIVISCVARDHYWQQLQQFITSHWPMAQVYYAQSQKQAQGICNAYLEPQKLGVDRWLAILASSRYQIAPLAIVDCGTAITLDVIDSNGQHQGGLISAGLNLMRQALHQNTKQLPYIESGMHANKWLAKNTQQAIDLGTTWAVVGFITCIVEQLNITDILLTGGDANYLAPYLPGNVIVNEQLVIEGLAMIALE